LNDLVGVQRAVLGETITLHMDRDGPLDEEAVRRVLENAGAELDDVKKGTPSVL
jgi:hypothetical protein